MLLAVDAGLTVTTPESGSLDGVHVTGRRTQRGRRRITVGTLRFAEKRPRSCFFCFDVETSVEGIIAPSGVSQSIVVRGRSPVLRTD